MARRVRLPPMPEREVLRQCLDLLRLLRVPHWRANTGALAASGADGRRRFVRFGPVGQSDILGVLPPAGRLLCVEVKRKGKRPTEAQSAFLANVEAAGGLAIVVHDALELRRALAAAGAPGLR